MSGVVRYFVKKGDTNVIETALFVAIRTETKSGPIKRKNRSKQRHIHTILRNALLKNIRNCFISIDAANLLHQTR